MTSVRTMVIGWAVVLSALQLPTRGLAAVAPGDHYMCYTAKLSPGQPAFAPSPVSLQDQLGGPQQYDVKKIVTICNPANVNGAAPQNPLVHQLGVQIKAQNGAPKFVKSDHLTDDEFGRLQLTFEAPDNLLDLSAQVLGSGGAPPLASDGGVDRFMCYTAKTAKGAPAFVPPTTSPTVTDDFVTGQTFNLKKVQHVCTPVDKNGETPGAETHTGHLVCYQAVLPKGATKPKPQVSVNSTNFGGWVLDSLGPSELCVPALKDNMCDPLDPSVCMYPFPNDWFTIVDKTTDSGRRVHFAAGDMPTNASGTPITPDDYNLNDGFSPGATILLHVPGVDLGMTGAAPVTNVAASLDADAPIVLVNATTLAHQLMWAEIDSNASSDATRSLIIHPAINLDEATRYIVALRNIKDSSGALITPNPDFVAYRDKTLTGDPVKESRRAHMEDLFTTLGNAGISRSDLYLAWDFTVASEPNLTDRLLFVRDDGFKRLGSKAPSFTVTSVQDDVDSDIFRRVTGTYNVERYVDSTTSPARMILGSNGLPLHQSTPQPASFICNIPRAALPSAAGPAVPARPSLYGHGLLGSNDEVNAGNVEDMGNEHNFVFCATKWIGMADEDVVNAISILQDLSGFPSLTDRLQQSMLDQLFLARLMIHKKGFISDPSFQDVSGNPVIDTSAVFYDGNSQGGIFGGTVMAIAQDITRGVLGVPGMNYSLLLTRSTDFSEYSAVLYPAYPDELTRPLLLALIQMLWDRSDPNGYAHHITSNPLPKTPTHKVLLHMAFGDHQVSNVSTEVEARTIGASIHAPAIAPGRNPDVTPYYGIPAIPSYPFDGSALVVWDSGSPAAPTTNTAPSSGHDPHEDPRSSPLARTQKSDFLQASGGAVVDVCSGLPCVAAP
ncbi:MAG TPA: hypothetical protein VN812_20995 [Candidatus Acidoferrales bacterium]|nr:hypothetical protein [Candidatus Acidoferrales bacterium]